MKNFLEYLLEEVKKPTKEQKKLEAQKLADEREEFFAKNGRIVFNSISYDNDYPIKNQERSTRGVFLFDKDDVYEISGRVSNVRNHAILHFTEIFLPSEITKFYNNIKAEIKKILEKEEYKVLTPCIKDSNGNIISYVGLTNRKNKIISVDSIKSEDLLNFADFVCDKYEGGPEVTLVSDEDLKPIYDIIQGMVETYTNMVEKEYGNAMVALQKNEALYFKLDEPTPDIKTYKKLLEVIESGENKYKYLILEIQHKTSDVRLICCNISRGTLCSIAKNGRNFCTYYKINGIDSSMSIPEKIKRIIWHNIDIARVPYYLDRNASLFRPK